jgi:hypothetical protein
LFEPRDDYAVVRGVLDVYRWARERLDPFHAVLEPEEMHEIAARLVILTYAQAERNQPHEQLTAAE